MGNQDTEATWTYHDSTKHSVLSIRNDPHYLDFDNQPLPFKIYSDLTPIPLSQEMSPTGVPALAATSTRSVSPDSDRIPDVNMLSNLLHHSAGITKRMQYPGGEIMFRAAACTGALYHIELYIVAGDLPGLEAGIYHFGTHDFALRKLRDGDYRNVLVRASGGEPAMSEAPAVVVCTGTYWRNAWKYRARAYRHCFWDSGTILANFLAMATANGLPARVVSGFADAPVNLLLGLDAQREVALTLVPLGRTRGSSAGPAPEAPLLHLNTEPLSRTEVDFPTIRAMHEESSIGSSEEAAAWHGETPNITPPGILGPLLPLRPFTDSDAAPVVIERVILRRGSTRQFGHVSITYEQFSTLLHRATKGVPADFLQPEGVMLNQLYVIVNAVDGLAPGAYVFHRDQCAIELLKEGDFRGVAGFLGLQQPLPADASVNVFFLTDLEPILARYGNRGYRAAQLEAGIIGGRIYLAAYAQRLGATGLTFFDDEVTTFFSPHAEGKSVMFLVAIGIPSRRGPQGSPPTGA